MLDDGVFITFVYPLFTDPNADIMVQMIEQRLTDA